jgi:hypothetical protein
MSHATAVLSAHPYRQLRLSHGWDLDHLAMRMKFVAALRGDVLPPVGLLTSWVFLWEHRRVAIPVFYDDLLTVTFAVYKGRTAAA